MQQFLCSMKVLSKMKPTDLRNRLQIFCDDCPFGTIDVADLINNDDGTFKATLKITVNTAETVSKYEVAEEMDLMTIYQPYDSSFTIGERIVTEN